MSWRRNRSRITRQGMIYERRIIALRRIQAQTPRPVDHRPTDTETQESRTRWLNLRHTI